MHAQWIASKRRKGRGESSSRSFRGEAWERLGPAPRFERISLISPTASARSSPFRAQKRLILCDRATTRFRENFFRRKGARRVSMGGGRNSIDNCSLALLITLVAVVASGFNWNTRVTTKFGDIKGLWSRSSRGRLVAHYLGIPYARPPLGDLRFRVSLLYSFSFFFFFLHRGYDREFLEKYFRVPGSVE